MTALALMAACLLMVVTSHSFARERPDLPQSSAQTGPSNALGPRSQADMWRTIRQGQPMPVPGRDPAVLIQSAGIDWQTTRDGVVRDYGMKLLGVVLVIVALYFLVRGRIRITGGRTGIVIPRFTLIQRVTHWSVAVLFVLLGVSGLILLVGRTLLKPLIGDEAFAVVASASMQGHNLFGPLFIPAIIALLLTFVRGNGYRLVDLKWAFKGGGFLGGHASSGKYNFGEKTWFWWSIALGIVLCVSGVAMLFPAMMPGRASLQLANLAHGGAAILFVAFGIGHVYLGTIGMEGALEGMTKGTVDEQWAKEHHDLWYEDHKQAATSDTTRAQVIAATTGDALPEGAAE